MMSDFIKYRIPGQKTVAQSGFFKKTNQYSGHNNVFVVSPYNSSEFYIFEECNLKCNSFHISKCTPSQYSYEEYHSIASQFLENITINKIKKAVLSRTKHVNFEISKSKELFECLKNKYPSAFIYLISSKHFGTWIGCTPEVLLDVHKNICHTVSLAGTKPTKSNEEWSKKERDEQQYVTDFMLNKLSDIQIKEINTNGPYPFEAGPVQHLKTDISFDIDNNTPLDIANEINPSPAVSGYPQGHAIDLINNLEKHSRDLYTGFIGVVSSRYANLFVNLRCCQLFSDKAVLYLGGGYTQDSKIRDEWEETEHKSKTLISAIDSLK